MRKGWKKVLAGMLAVSMVMGSVTISNMRAEAEETTNKINFALGAEASVNDQETEGWGADKAVDGIVNRNAEKQDQSRWSTNKDEGIGEKILTVDLGGLRTFDEFTIEWERTNVRGFYIAVSENGENYTNVYEKTDDTDVSMTTKILLDVPVSGRYVKLVINNYHGGDLDWPSVSVYEFEVIGNLDNLAFGKTAVASSIEANSVEASNATDGDTSSRSSRWGSAIGNGPHWIYVDLGDTKSICTVRVFWETRKATAYEIQISDTAADGSWSTVKTFADRPADLKDTIVFDEAKQARYVRLYIDAFTAKDPDAEEFYNSISIYEMEVYGVALPTEEDPGEITIETPKKGDQKLVVNIPTRAGYTITYNGTDYEQVVDRDLTIYQPIVDTTVNVSFKIVNNNNPADYSFEEIAVTIPGKYSQAAGDNAAPRIIPELREWKGSTGNFTVSDSARIVIADNALKDMADAFAADYEDMTGKSIQVVTGEAKDGDFYFALTSDTSKGLQDEGYIMEIDDKVSVEAETTTGAFWATRTILQALKSGNNTIPKGITRDYPLYKVRGYILDVGRKTFTMNQLEQIVKQMSWYKMNDFQVHLNDNLIPLENYSKAGKDPMTAYSGFRLESDIKEGGNGGLNQADLTSTDVFYTKEEFRNLIQESRVYGVNIVPEIDTPAHSLALTKVRPDLRHGIWGRDNDHLNLTTKYNDSLAFVQSIFDEYMGGELSNPVFDEDTIIHVGADEYSADGNAYRRFCNDMLAYVQDSGRTARIWGSLSSIRGDVEVTSEGVQMNLWNFGWANMDKMYELGFDLINCNDGNYYIVPNAGYYYDYLNAGIMYNLNINSIGGVTIPAGDEQMLGGAFAVWNDMTDYLDNGVSEYDVYDRFNDSLGLFAAKLWGKGSMSLEQAQEVSNTMGDAPNTNFGYEAEADADGKIAHITAETMKELDGVNVVAEKVDYKEALKLAGGRSYVETGLETVGLGNDLRVKVKRTGDSTTDQILFESPYGSIKAVQGKTGKVGITRENFDYSFNYELPVDEWVELEFKNEFEVVSLYVNGVLVDTLGDGERIEGRPMLATCMLPVAKIGSETNAFEGYVADVRIGADAEYNSTMELDYAVWAAKTLLATKSDTELSELIEQAKEVIGAFSADGTAVNNLADAIYERMKAIDYKKADYERVDAYIAQIPKDLSIFTPESVAVLELALQSVQRDLPIAMQERVDSYEAALAGALTQLEMKKTNNANYVDNAKLTATASSYQDGSASPDKALDNDPTTMWHQKWADTTSRHWIDFKINELTAINGITYVPRSGGGNGNLQEYTIAVSSDNGANYRDIKSGSLENNADTKVIEFDGTEVTNVRIYFDRAVGGNASAAEVKLHLANVAPDMDGLGDVITAAAAVKKGNYTEESWDELQSVIEAARSLAADPNANAEDVEVMKRELSKKMVALQLNAVAYADAAQMKALEDFAASTLDEEKYKEEDVAAFYELQNTVKSVLDGKVTAKTATQLLNDIDALMDSMQPIEKPEDPENPEEPEKPEEPENPEEPGNPEEPENPGKPGESGNQNKPGDQNKPTETDKGSVQTGDTAMVLLWMMFIMAAAVVILFTRKRRIR